MTTYVLGKLHSDKQNTLWRNALRITVQLALIISIGVLAFAAVNTALPWAAEMRMQSTVNALNQEGLTTQRQQAMTELENAGEAAVPALIVALRSENPVLRRNAADMLGYIASPQALTALRYTLLNDLAPQVRRDAAWALGEIQGLASLNDLEQAAVLDKNQSVRHAAADSIARIRTRLALTAGVNESALSAFAVAPGDSNRAYLATRRDLVSTRDGGKTWTTHANALPSLVATLKTGPTDDQELYASTDGLGLFKSTDGGITWSTLNTGLGLMPGARFSATALAIDPTNPQQLFSSTGVWLGTSHVEFYPIALMRSVDRGATWQLYRKSSNVQPITQLAVKGDRLYALAGDQVLIY